MGGNRFLQALQVVAAFQDRDNAPARGLVGKVHQLLRDPAEILGVQIQRGEGIAIMRIEARGDDDQFRAELCQLRQDQVLERGAEFGAAVLAIATTPVR